MSLDPAHAGGTQIGKRYTDADAALEVLCTKAGEGALPLVTSRSCSRKPSRCPSSD